MCREQVSWKISMEKEVPNDVSGRRLSFDVHVLPYVGLILRLVTWEPGKRRKWEERFLFCVCLKHSHKTLTLSAHKTLGKHFITSFVKFAGVNSLSKMTTRKKKKKKKEKLNIHTSWLCSLPEQGFSDPRPWISGITLSNAAEWELLANRLAPSQTPSSHVVIVRVRLGCSLFLPLSFSLSFASRDKPLPLLEEGNGARPHLPFGSSRAELQARRRGESDPDCSPTGSTLAAILFFSHQLACRRARHRFVVLCLSEILSLSHCWH